MTLKFYVSIVVILLTAACSLSSQDSQSIDTRSGGDVGTNGAIETSDQVADGAGDRDITESEEFAENDAAVEGESFALSLTTGGKTLKGDSSIAIGDSVEVSYDVLDADSCDLYYDHLLVPDSGPDGLAFERLAGLTKGSVDLELSKWDMKITLVCDLKDGSELREVVNIRTTGEATTSLPSEIMTALANVQGIAIREGVALNFSQKMAEFACRRVFSGTLTSYGNIAPVGIGIRTGFQTPVDNSLYLLFADRLVEQNAQSVGNKWLATLSCTKA